MRATLLPLLLITGMTFAGAAFADTTTAATTTAPAATAAAPAAKMAAMTPTVTNGTIKSISTKSLYVTLTNGSRYHVAKGFALKDFKVGEKVSITWEWKNKLHTVSSMKAA